MKSAEHNVAAAMALFDGLAAGEPLDVVVSPGSRSTPLTLAAHGHPRCRVHVVLDERAAGFFALGLGRRSGRPAALVCTSGSAATHYAPAIAEAHHAAAPLVAISANRPPELHGLGAPQTMRQDGLFGGFVRDTTLLPVPDGEVPPAVWRAAGARARVATLGDHPGPVHLDAPFREPLWSRGLSFPDAVTTTGPLRGRRQLDEAGLAALETKLAGRRGLVVAGPASPPGADLNGVLSLASALGWPVLADPASGLRFGHEVISTYDVACRSSALDALAPDVVVTLGLPPTSKSLGRWLMRHEVEIVRLDAAGRGLDPTLGLSQLVVADPNATCAALATRALAPAPAAWLEAWRERDTCARAVIDGATAEGDWSGNLARRLLEALGTEAQLHLASSMPIREVDAFGAPGPRALRVQASRGVNGIDGTLATAAGEALAHPGPTLALVGDLTLLHDLDGLEAIGPDIALTAVVIDNGGGGIFSYLPIAAHEDPAAFSELFLTPRPTAPETVARALGHRAQRLPLAELDARLRAALERPGLDVLVVPIDRETDVARHRATYRAVADALGGDV